MKEARALGSMSERGSVLTRVVGLHQAMDTPMPSPRCEQGPASARLAGLGETEPINTEQKGMNPGA